MVANSDHVREVKSASTRKALPMKLGRVWIGRAAETLSTLNHWHKSDTEYVMGVSFSVRVLSD